MTLTTGALAFGALELPGAESAAASGALSKLPAGSAPEPVALPHFPDRLHAFVWRNWSLIPPERMASVVGAKPADMIRLGQSMGLGRPPKVTPEQRLRSYITVIRRNWHLLPYEQLLELLGWSAEELEYTLREDDFLFIKLGSLKPRCERLRYQPPDAAARQREAEIAGTIRELFPAGPDTAAEPPFHFVNELSRSPGGKPLSNTSNAPARLKFCYSYFALYGDPLLATATDPYPDGYLERLAQSGVNGVWLQAVLSKLAPFPWDPSASEQHELRLKNLGALVARAKRHGVQVFLYLNEPRSLPLAFFDKHPELKGVTEGDHATLCTSVPEVQQFLVQSIETICRAVPDLGGFFTITASENLTNCWSHGNANACPRCSKRSPAEVIAEVNSLVQQGIRQSGAKARLLAWDWGWNDAWALEAIRQLPAEASLMSVSEWGMPVEHGGVRTDVGEYSISVIGPGERARRHWKAARERGLRTIAKIQTGNTWELSSIPYLPVLENVARHAENLSHAEIDGLMLGWTLGGCPSPNLEAVSETLACGSAEEALRHVANHRFGPDLGRIVVTAWKQFSVAFREFPFHAGLLYNGPQQVGPANPLWEKPTHYAASMVGFPYDDLNAWRAVYPAPVYIRQFEAVARGFTDALKELKLAASGLLAGAKSAHREAFDSECCVAEAAAIHFESVANQARFILERQALAEAKTPGDIDRVKTILATLLDREIDLARRLHALQTRDSRIGFEASNHYFYIPMDLAEKALNCRDLQRRWLQSGERAGA
jgi:hypothetical protein